MFFSKMTVWQRECHVTFSGRRSGRGHSPIRRDYFDFGSALCRPLGSNEGNTRGGRALGQFPVARAERRRDRPGETRAKPPVGRKIQYFILLYKRTKEARGSASTEVLFPLFLKCMSTQHTGPKQNPLKSLSTS